MIDAGGSTEEVLGDLAEALTEIEDDRAECPLGWWRPWDRELPRTSQRRAVEALVDHRTVLVFGGNRSGKSALLLALLVALAIGSDHPHAARFWRSCDVDPDAFPRGPGECILVALTSSDSVRYHRDRLDEILPPDRQWYNRTGRGEAYVSIPCPGHPGREAKIWLKSEDQGAESYQGMRVRAVGHDEEGRTADVWDQADKRLADENGWHVLANTPENGLTWVYDRFVATTPDGVACRWIHGTDNPYLPDSGLRRLTRGDPARDAAALRGEFVSRRGRVYPQFSRALHVVDPFEIPSSWIRFRGIDFGTRNPACWLWCALSPDGVLVVYREHYVAEWTLAQHVARARELERGERIELTWADPEDAQQILALRVDHDMEVVPAVKAVRAGIDAVAERLRPGVDGRPGLVVFSSCPNTIREHETYSWPESSGARDPDDRPLKRHDHSCDVVRYVCVGVRSYV